VHWTYTLLSTIRHFRIRLSGKLLCVLIFAPSSTATWNSSWLNWKNNPLALRVDRITVHFSCITSSHCSLWQIWEVSCEMICCHSTTYLSLCPAGKTSPRSQSWKSEQKTSAQPIITQQDRQNPMKPRLSQSRSESKLAYRLCHRSSLFSCCTLHSTSKNHGLIQQDKI